MGFFSSVTKSLGDLLTGGSGFGTGPGGAGLLGNDQLLDLIPGIGDARAQDRANAENRQLYSQNLAWMERMSNTAYQRATEDMKKAGINPILAYQQGGASVPSSNAPTISPSSKTRLADVGLQAFTGISNAQSQAQQANTAQAQSQSSIALQGAQTAAAVAETEKKQAEAARTRELIKNDKARRSLDEQAHRLKRVEESAKDMAHKGLGTATSALDHVLRNTAKPNVNPRTLRAEPPMHPSLDNLLNDDVKNYQRFNKRK